MKKDKTDPVKPLCGAAALTAIEWLKCLNCGLVVIIITLMELIGAIDRK